MERAAFLLEQTGERIGCLLNPESVVMRRVAGIRQRHSETGPLTGSDFPDDPLLYTGGGTTQLTLDLLFDVSIAGSSVETEDVRELTAPLWALTENAARGDELYGRPPLARFIWGKYWNMPGVVVAIAERLEFFTESGAPRRSWLRMLFRRVTEKLAQAPPASNLRRLHSSEAEALVNQPDQMTVHQAIGGGPAADGEADRLSRERCDSLADHYLGDASLWRWIAAANNLDDPLHIPPGTVLRIPTPSARGSQ